MANVTIPGSLQLMFSIDGHQTYAVMEEALVDAGFTNYRIDRQSYESYMDVTISLDPPRDPNTGQQTPFDAEQTLTQLAAAVAHFGD